MKSRAEEWIRCARSPKYFIKKYAVIQDPATFSEFPFALWDFQEELLDLIEANRTLIVLKARQLGVSWLVAAYALWSVEFHSNANVLLLSKREDESQKLLDKVKFIYDRLPEWLRAPEYARNNSTLVLRDERGGKGSRITALPATEDAGRSETGSLIIADEWAFHPYATTNYAAFRPAISAGGAKFVGVSTANGVGTFFHDMWLSAKRGTTGFAYRFIPWNAHPARDQRWYDQEKANYPSAMQEFYQEHPATEDEAFIAAGGCVFDLEALTYYMNETVKEELAPKDIKNPKLRELAQQGVLHVYEEPVPWAQYIAGFDPAQGLENGDESAAEWVNASTGAQVCEFACHWDIDLATRAVHDICRAYHDAFLAVERNNHGHTALYILEDQLGYSGPQLLYYSTPPKVGKPDSGTSGFTTGTQTKKRRDDFLIAAVREHSVDIRSRFWVEQAKGYIRHKDGSVGAIGTAVDDRVTAMSLAWYAKFERPMRRSVRRPAFRRPAFRRG